MSSGNFIEKIWYLPRKSWSIFYPIFSFLNLPFLALVKLKRYFYQKGVFSVNSFEKPVLVVGNISVGCTGKTPFISQLIKQLNKKNIKCGIVSRGYKAQITQFPHQVNSTDTSNQVGDEAFMLFKQMQIPVVIDANRARAVNYLLKNNKVDIVISDDGLQHYKMSRDLEIILVDSTRMFGNEFILPMGPLREPVSRCKTVKFVIQNGARDLEHHGDSRINHQVKIVPKCLVNINSGKEISFDSIKTKSIIAIAGIGNPQRFFSTLNEIVDVAEKHSFPDHHSFREDDFTHLSRNITHMDKGSVIIMTEKDAVKCTEFAEEHWYYLRVEMTFKKELIGDLISKVQQVIKRKNNG